MPCRGEILDIHLSDLDQDGVLELVFTSFEIYHLIYYIKLGYGLVWSRIIEGGEFGDLLETSAPIDDSIEVVNITNDKKIKTINSVILSQDTFYVRQIVLDLEGKALFNSSWIAQKYIPTTLKTLIINDTIYFCVIRYEWLFPSEYYKYSIIIYDTERKQVLESNLVLATSWETTEVEVFDNLSYYRLLVLTSASLYLYEID